jgi:3-methyladenine DNA glycosylase AlkD
MQLKKPSVLPLRPFKRLPNPDGFGRRFASLYRLAKSEDLWERRIAVLATFYFIKHGKYEETLKIAEILLTDREDLIHKAVGWMLREIGKRDMIFEEMFLKQHYKEMPRTMLRYAIEKFPEPKRQKYLKGEI